MSVVEFHEALRPKVKVTWNLHNIQIYLSSGKVMRVNQAFGVV